MVNEMLKGIPKIVPPELLKVLAEMGHSDRIVIADGNFPAESMGKDCIVIRMDGHGVPEVLDAVLSLIPLDGYVEHPMSLMEVMPGDDAETPIWDTYREIVRKYEERGDRVIQNVEKRCLCQCDAAKRSDIGSYIACGKTGMRKNGRWGVFSRRPIVLF